MSDAIGAALIAAVSSVVGSLLLTFIVGIRQIRRSVSTSNGTPLGPALDGRLELIELLKGTFSLTRRPDQRRCSTARSCCSLSSTRCSAA
jgi:hypothetical protein